MAKRKGRRPELSDAAKDEVRVGLKRLLRRLVRMSVAKSRLEAREKDLRAECKSQLDLLGDALVEVTATATGTPGGRGQLVTKTPVMSTDEANLALCEKELTKAEFVLFCPRSIQVKKLKAAKPDLVKKLATSKKTEFRFDLVQAEAASRSA